MYALDPALEEAAALVRSHHSQVGGDGEKVGDQPVDAAGARPRRGGGAAVIEVGVRVGSDRPGAAANGGGTTEWRGHASAGAGASRTGSAGGSGTATGGAPGRGGDSCAAARPRARPRLETSRSVSSPFSRRRSQSSTSQLAASEIAPRVKKELAQRWRRHPPTSPEGPGPTMMGGRCVNLGDRLATHRARGSLRLHHPPLCRPNQYSPPPEQEVAAEVAVGFYGSLDLKATKS